MSVQKELNDITRRLLENATKATIAELYGANSFLRILQENAMSGAEGTAPPAAMAAVAGELRPPPEHADKLLHWVQDEGDAPEVAMWSQESGLWSFLGESEEYAPGSDGAAWYRYLGPAEWRPSRLEQLMDELAALPPHGRPDLPYPGPHHVTAARIAELEAEVARLAQKLHGGLGPIVTPPGGTKYVHVTQARRIYELEAENARLNGMLAGKVSVSCANAKDAIKAGLSHTFAVAALSDPVTQTVVSAHTVARGDGSLTCMITNAGSRYFPEIPTTTVSGPTDDPSPTNPTDAIHQEVERVIGNIAGGKVNPPARKALRGALDKAEAPPQGRAASDAAIGRIAKMESAAPLPMGVMR
jgi:hypothetical protein